MHGIGNDFVIVDARSRRFEAQDELARRLCDRRLGVGGDGLVFVETAPANRFRMRMINPDGSESEMCGNGLRCVALWLTDQVGATSFEIETGELVSHAEVLSDREIRVSMGEITVISPDRAVGEWSGVEVSVSNPHFVIFTDDVDAIPLESVGPKIEHDEAFANRTNVHFVQVIDRSTIRQRTWERGAGITLACGSGACASAVAAHRRGLTDDVIDVRLPGGRLSIEIQATGQVTMTGPAEYVFTGSVKV